jgi:hypothetical protein
MHAAAYSRVVTTVEKGQRLVLLTIVEPHSVFATSQSGLWLSDPKGRWAPCMARLEQESLIVGLFGHCVKLVSQRASGVVSFSTYSVYP